jgi:hypothetical protein
MAAVEKLAPGRRLLIGVVTLLMSAVGFAAGRILLRPAGAVRQPVEFNHRLHVKEVELECNTCHLYYETSLHSGLPDLELCMECHEEALTESPEEQRLLELANGDIEVPFKKLFRMPDHVYYSHREHVALADIECEICHGDIADSTVPPATALVNITMDTCVNCHAERGVMTDCTHCHR